MKRGKKAELEWNLRVGVINRLPYIIFVFSYSKPDLISKKPLLYANFWLGVAMLKRNSQKQWAKEKIKNETRLLSSSLSLSEAEKEKKNQETLNRCQDWKIIFIIKVIISKCVIVDLRQCALAISFIGYTTHSEKKSLELKSQTSFSCSSAQSSRFEAKIFISLMLVQISRSTYL